MALNPRQEYIVHQEKTQLKSFHDYKDDYITRPPYQRKSVWPVKKQQQLFDSLFRRYYIQALVIREVRLADDRTVQEIIDGQQRITAIQDFFADKFKLPQSLLDISKDLPGRTFSELSTELRKFIDRELRMTVDLIKNIEDPKNPDHQQVATQIFWRLQQGEALTFMEVEHAKLSSLVRNFVVKYSDDETFDFPAYKPVDHNPDKHPFFKIIVRKNDRMQHLQLLTRLLMIERANNYTDLKDSAVVDFISSYERKDGIGDYSLENEDFAKSCLANLTELFKIFKDDPMIDATAGVQELRREYLIISLYVLVRHLRAHYLWNADVRTYVRKFFYSFFQRWDKREQSDLDIQVFSNSRQQSANDLTERDIIMRQLFFDYLTEQGLTVELREGRRAFNESERIHIYRNDKGICQRCIGEGKPEKEATVSWSQYEADHIFPFALGGKTVVGNGQVLCKYHNASKGARVELV